MIHITTFDSLGALHSALRDFIIKQAKGKKQLSIALSGGSTPLAWFTYMGNHPISDMITNAKIFWVDERFVPNNDERNNSNHAIDRWLSRDNLHYYPVDTSKPSAVVSAEQYTGTLSAELSGSLDLVVLGMGADGHIASLFPNSAQNTKEVFACTHPSDGTERISMNYAMLAAAQQVVLFIQGKQKLEVLKDGNQNLPIHTLADMADINVYYID